MSAAGRGYPATPMRRDCARLSARAAVRFLLLATGS